MISGIHVHTTRDISKLSQISLAILLQVQKTILKYHSWYLCQISYRYLLIMRLPILILWVTNYTCNIIGDELLLNFGVKFQR